MAAVMSDTDGIGSKLRPFFKLLERCCCWAAFPLIELLLSEMRKLLLTMLLEAIEARYGAGA